MDRRCACRWGGIALLAAALGGAPASQPSDPTVDWLLSQATTAPAPGDQDAPATRPGVLEAVDPVSVESRDGRITLSDGSVHSGKLSTTLRQPIRVWVAEQKQYQDIPFSLIRSIEAHVVWEGQDKEWKFKESGSDIKEYSGRTYPAREMQYTLALKDGSAVTGGVAAPIYLDLGAQRETYILHKTDKGEAGQSLEELVYVKQVEIP